jgi:hypothetical protein
MPGEAGADEFKLIPSVNLKGEYNDNLFFTEKRKKDDFVTTLSPGLELINKTERLDVSLLARASGLLYADNHDLNGIDQYYRGKLRYSLHPKWSLSGEAGFTRDSTPDRDIEATGLVNKAIRRYKYIFTGGLDHRLTEKTTADLSYSYERQDYERDPEFVDIDSHGVNLGLNHDLSKHFSNTIGRVNLSYFRYEFGDSKTDYLYTTIGMRRALSEKWSFLLDAGGSYTHSKFVVDRLYPITPFLSVVVRDEETEKGAGWVGQATLSYKGERTVKGEKTKADLTFQHRLLPSSGRVGVTKRTALTLEALHHFTYEFSGRLSAGYFLNKSKRGEFSNEAIDEATFRVNPRVRYEFTKDLALEASYHFTFLRDRQERSEAKRNLFMIHLIIQYPLFE